MGDEMRHVREDLGAQARIAEEELANERAQHAAELNRVKKQQVADEFEGICAERTDKIRGVEEDQGTRAMVQDHKLAEESEPHKRALEFEPHSKKGSSEPQHQLSEQSADVEDRRSITLARVRGQHAADRDDRKWLGVPAIAVMMVLVFSLGSLLGLAFGARLANVAGVEEEPVPATLVEYMQTTGEDCPASISSTEEVAEQ